MMRILFLLLIALLSGYFYLQGKVNQRIDELPSFLRTDAIANGHQTQIGASFHSNYLPTENQSNQLIEDYSNLWAHLNHLYATNDVTVGKEYYTEAWFKQLCQHYDGVQEPLIIRTDVQHQLHVMNWSKDGLVCNVIDSNVVFNYEFPDNINKKTMATIALALLYQGDHWRLDAFRIINEKEITNN
jgi:hypothetical protein